MATKLKKQKPGKFSGWAIPIGSALLACATANFTVAQVQAPQSGISGTTASANIADEYQLGAGDEIVVFAAYADDISNKAFRISVNGDISFPRIGPVHVIGMTTTQLETEVTKRLSVYIKAPDVRINVSQMKSQPVSISGEVGAPGTIQLEGRKTLTEVLIKVGGLKPDASRIVVRRRQDAGMIPLATAKFDGEYSVAEIRIRNSNLERSQDDIWILSNDVIYVPRAEVVYVLGEVRNVGAVSLGDEPNIPAWKVLAKASGTLNTAAKSKATVIRQIAGSDTIVVPVNIDDVMNGKNKLVLWPGDILYVPDSFAKSTAKRTIENVIQMAVGVAILR